MHYSQLFSKRTVTLVYFGKDIFLDKWGIGIKILISANFDQKIVPYACFIQYDYCIAQSINLTRFFSYGGSDNWICQLVCHLLLSVGNGLLRYNILVQ